ncbi:MAG: sigma factor, partial [Nocardioides sp.]
MEKAARDAEFSAYLQARQAHLLRTAYLLTGDHASAEDLVQTAMAKLYLSWEKVQARDSLDGYVRRIMINERNSLWRRPWKRRERSTSELPQVATTDRYDDGQTQAVWE